MALTDAQQKRKDAKRARRAARRKLEERVRYTKESPLLLKGSITRTETHATHWRHLERPLRAVLKGVPKAGTSKEARKRAKEIRVAIMLAGLAIILWGGSLHTALLGCIVAIVGSALPMAHATHMRWEQRARSMSAGRVTTIEVEVDIRFDGRGVSVMDEQTSLRRVLTRDGAAQMTMRRVNEYAALNLVPTEGGRSAQLWFVAKNGTERRVDPEQLRQADPGGVDMPVTVSGEALMALHEALRSDEMPPWGAAPD